MQRRDLLWAGVAGLCGGSAGAWAAPARLRPVTLVAQALDQMKQLPLVLAWRLGYFAAEGLEVSLQVVPPTVRTLEALANVQALVFAGTFERTLYLNARGLPHQAFALISRSPQVVLGTSTRHLPANAGLADLAGCNVGVYASGSLSHRVAQLVLLRAGMRPSDVHFVEMPTAQGAWAALEQGDIDAVSYTDPLITRLEQRGVIRVIADTRTLRESDHVFGGPVACTCLSAPLSFIEREPEVVQGLTNGVVRALKWLHTAAPADLVRYIPQALMQGDRAVFLSAFNRSLETFAVDGTFAEQAPRNVLRALERLRLPVALGGVNLETVYTNRFAQRAKVQFRV